jgi:hypothetical protein
MNSRTVWGGKADISVEVSVRLGFGLGWGVAEGKAVRVSATVVPIRSLYGLAGVPGPDGKAQLQAEKANSTGTTEKESSLERFTRDLLPRRIKQPSTRIPLPVKRFPMPISSLKARFC